MAKRGQPSRFRSGEQLIALWSDFCNDIVEQGFDRAPTQTEFCRWLSKKYEDTDRKTIYNSLNKYFPTIKKDFERLQSDTIMQGGMLGKYNPTMSIFGLKNWCGWSDSGKNTSRHSEKERQEDPLTKSLREEAERLNNGNFS